MNTEELKEIFRDIKPHKAGYSLIKEALIWLLIANGVLYFLQINSILFQIFASLSILTFVYAILVFRSPERAIVPDEDAVFSPVDGKVTAVEIVEESDYFKDKRLKVSFCTGPFQIHMKRVPVTGKVISCKFEQGNVAETVLETNSGLRILLCQEVGYFKKFIFSFAEEGKYYVQGEELGVLGSNFTIYIPSHLTVKVKVGEQVRANVSIIAK